MMKMILLGAVLALGATAHASDKFKIDPGHASVVFKINHLGFSNVYGMFGDVNGDMDLDDKGDKSSLTLDIKTSSITTLNTKRDEHLAKPDFFDAKQFPTITFKSTSMKKTGDRYNVKGNLTMHGKTNPVEFTLTRNRTGNDPWGKVRTGGDATFHVKRSDFGMKFMQGPTAVGDDVEIMVSAEGIKQ
jgi:polyisoprenoid-binding protein YceI